AAGRAAAALERPQRGHEFRRSAPRAAVLRAAARRGDSVLQGAPRREAGAHRLGAGEVPLRLLGRGCPRGASLRPLLHQASLARVRSDDSHRHGEGDRVRERSEVSAASDAPQLGTGAVDETLTVARNVSTRYLAIAVEAILGLVVLPFNIAHLGQSAYGLWMLTASVTAYFSVLDLGYGGALVKFVAQYRARRDVRALNEILSTTFVVFATFGVVTYLVAIAIAVYMGQLFQLTPEQVHTGRIVMLIISLSVAVGTAVSVFGAVNNGFQRFDLNNLVGTAASVITAAVNVAVLLAGYGLVELVAATTTVRLLSYVVYRANAYRVFPAMQIRIRWFRRERLREVTSFSVFMLLIDWANKLNYSIDALVI